MLKLVMLNLVFVFFLLVLSSRANAACTSPTGTVGTVRYISGDLKYCNDTDWVSMAVSDTGLGCTTAGEINYSAGDFRFCNGTNWMSMNSGISVGSCTGTATGTFRWNSGQSRMEWCNGTNWTTLSPPPPDCDLTSPAIGTTCDDGTIYAGVGNYNRYQVTPGGCTNSATPTCAGGTDSLTKKWYGTSGSYSDLAGLNNLASATTLSVVPGQTATGIIIADAAVSSNSGADYCNDLNYGGYTDWFLPNKSELSYLLCKSNRSSALTASFPPDDPDCVRAGGKSTSLTGFASSLYLSTDEESNVYYWGVDFSNGGTGINDKNSNSYVRCIRDISDRQPVAINWPDFNDTSSSQTFLGINVPLRLGISVSGVIGNPLILYRVNGTSWQALQISTPIYVDVSNNDTLQFKVDGDVGNQGTITILNSNDSNSLLDTTTGLVTLASTDPCRGTPSRGTSCLGGAIYAGQFDSGSYMITPSGCNDSSTPICTGATDSLQKPWRGVGINIAGVENISSAATPSTQRGIDALPFILAEPGVTADSAAYYCANMMYGGYEDWTLPSKSEMAYIYCHNNTTTHNTSYPTENPNCVGYGGKTSALTGFIKNNVSEMYYVSTEGSTSSAWKVSMYDGSMSASGNKNGNNYVRCIRRY